MLRQRIVLVLLSICAALALAAVVTDESASTSAEDVIPSEATVAPTTNGDKNEAAWPADLPTCEQNIETLGQCLSNVFEFVLKRYKQGNKELKIPATDPFVLNRTVFQYSNGPVSGRIIMRNGQVHGFSQFKHESVDFQLLTDDKFKLRSVAEVPVAIINGQYKAEILFNNVQLRPRGDFNITMTKLNMNISVNGEFYEQSGHRFMRLLDFNAEPKVGGFKFAATGMFPDPTLNEIALNIINQYWRDIFRVFLPETRNYWAPMLKHLFNEATRVIPLDTFVKQQ